jgi:hypothetical protein
MTQPPDQNEWSSMRLIGKRNNARLGLDIAGTEAR